jgi:hypothetical protein
MDIINLSLSPSLPISFFPVPFFVSFLPFVFQRVLSRITSFLSFLKIISQFVFDVGALLLGGSYLSSEVPHGRNSDGM